MENKLQVLTDKLFQEGVNKGKEEGEKILQDSRNQAARILEEAKAEADAIVKKARKETEDLKNNSLTEIKITSRQMLASLKQDIENALLQRTVAPGIHSALEQAGFVQTLILKAMENFRPEQHNGLQLELLLPEQDRKDFDSFLKENIGAVLKEGIEVSYQADMRHGFAIVNKTEGYMLRFAEEDFMALFFQYARPRIKELLF